MVAGLLMGGAWNLKVLVGIGICVYSFLPQEVTQVMHMVLICFIRSGCFVMEECICILIEKWAPHGLRCNLVVLS